MFAGAIATACRKTHYHRAHDSTLGCHGKGANGSRIDWIVHTGEFKTTDAQIIQTPAKDGVFPSDHYPVMAVLAWR